jgi:DNA-binding transcriptional regulator YbjK
MTTVKDPPSEARRDAVVAAALATIRRAIVEGQPVTRSQLAQEASVALGESPGDALKEVDAEAQRLGVSSLL